MTYEEIEQLLAAQLGEIEPNDQYHYRLLLDSWRMYLDCLAEIAEKGINVVSKGGGIRINPAINPRNEAHKQILKLSKLFGIEPLNRSEGSDSEDDEMQRLIED